MLRAVFAECARTLEPGGRIAVNVANLGRRPYRSLSADITAILQDDLRLLLRGEIIWVKQRGAAGRARGGSFQRAGNPVLRDLTERVIVALEGPFRPCRAPAGAAAPEPPERVHALQGRVHGGDARHVGDPPRVGAAGRAPRALPGRAARTPDRPVHLPGRPGARPVHGVRNHRRRRGAVRPALRRLRHRPRLRRAATERIERSRPRSTPSSEAARPAPRADVLPAPDPRPGRARSRRGRHPGRVRTLHGRAAKELAREMLELAGFGEIESGLKVGGVEMSFVVRDAEGRRHRDRLLRGVQLVAPGAQADRHLVEGLGRASTVLLLSLTTTATRGARHGDRRGAPQHRRPCAPRSAPAARRSRWHARPRRHA